jgi:CRP-like cAMP-binding protein
MSAPSVSLLRDIPFFEGLTPGELELAAGKLHMQHFAAGASLFSSEQPGEVAYIILQGAVKVYMDHPDGRSVILAILGPGDIVGEMSLIDHLARSASTLTLDECSMLWLDRADFRRCLEEIPTLNYNLARILARRLRRTNAQIQSLAGLDLYSRVARQLVVLAREYGEALPASRGTHDTSRAGPGSTGHPELESIRIPFRLTQVDLANLVGATRGPVNGVLGSFKDRAFITVDTRHYVTLLNMAALTDLCE